MTTHQDMVQHESSKPQYLAELPTVAPPVDIYENGEEILLVADIPGVAAADVDVRLENGQLDLEAKQVPPKDEDSLPPVRFARSFRVPDSVDPAGVIAELNEGVLRVHLKKSELAKPRRIQVTSSS